MNGHQRERQVRKLLEQDGWVVTRAAGSLGDADLWAARIRRPPTETNGEPVYVDFLFEFRMIEVKANKDGGPYKSFGPADRDELRAAAKKAGATAWLAYWPAHKPIRWIEEKDWPK